MSSNPIKVLLVEDNLVASKMGALIISELGCGIDVATDGEEAVALVKENDYDLILMDLGLPKMDGFDATLAIRKISTKNFIPIVALTAHSDKQNQQRVKEVGMNGFSVKPLTTESCQELVNRYVKK